LVDFSKAEISILAVSTLEMSGVEEEEEAEGGDGAAGCSTTWYVEMWSCEDDIVVRCVEWKKGGW
jgi:hypothetical protein